MIRKPFHKPKINKLYKLKNKMLLYPEGIVTLNDTAHKILLLCDGEHTTQHIKEKIFHEYTFNETTDKDIDEMVFLFYSKNWIN